MEIIIGIAIIAAGVGFAIYQTKKMNGLNLEIQAVETSKIADAKEIVDSLSITDSNYRHYVELKGTAFTKERVVAPFTEREVVYYEDTTYAVSEETRRYTDKDGHQQTRTEKKEERLSYEKSPVQVFVRDDSCQEGICLDIETFSDCIDLQSGCDRMERESSDWMRRHNNYSSIWGRGTGSKFLGYRLVEKMFMLNQPVYILGELYKLGDTYYVGRTRLGNKTSKLTYKSEDELVANNESSKKMSWVAAGVALLVGLFVMYQGIR